MVDALKCPLVLRNQFYLRLNTESIAAATIAAFRFYPTWRILGMPPEFGRRGQPDRWSGELLTLLSP
jgi:hypothetical protein